MTDINILLKENYQEHPAFSFDESPWYVNEEAVNLFLEKYELVKAASSDLKKECSELIYQDAKATLFAVFDSLESQANDRFELHFIRELRDRCERVLRNEFVWFTRNKNKIDIEKIDANFYKNTLGLIQNYFFNGSLSIETVQEIKAVANDQVKIFRENVRLGKLERDDLSINHGTVVSKIVSILNRDFESLGVLDSLATYSGCKMHVVGCALELSVAEAKWWKNVLPFVETGPKTLYAHLDEALAHPKSIVYLSDVDELSGGTSCYPGIYDSLRLNAFQELIGRVVYQVGSDASSNLFDYYANAHHQPIASENFRRHFMRIPEILRFNSHFGWDVFPGNSLESVMSKSEIKMTGSAGSFIVFDGAKLLHRGGLVQANERLALQVIFAQPKTMTRRVLDKAKRVVKF